MKQRKKKYHLKKKWLDILFAIQMWLIIIVVQVTVTLAVYWICAGV